MAARREQREEVGVRGAPEVWAKSPARIDDSDMDSGAETESEQEKEKSKNSPEEKKRKKKKKVNILSFYLTFLVLM